VNVGLIINEMVMVLSLQVDLCGIAKISQTPVAALIPKTILYVQTKDMASRLYSYLVGESVNRSFVGVYHASLTPQTKSTVYKVFKSGTSCMKCLVATVAFGMVCYLPFFCIVKPLNDFLRVWMFVM
jgi:superfamily II DNA helicase RecQ